MSLIGNRSVLHKSPGRFLAGQTASGDRSNFSKQGMLRSSRHSFGKLASLPNGYGATGWLMPVTAGALSSMNAATIALAASGLAVGGVTTDGTSTITITAAPAVAFPLDDTSPTRTASAAITFTVADAAGQLISSGSGSASLAVTIADALMTASVEGSGTAAFSVTANTPTLGAEASGSGFASISFVVAPVTAFPLNDASPLRGGQANMAFSGTLAPYGVGHMQGSTADTTILTADIIANAVWDALAAQHTDSLTMGGKVNTASSGGVDINALADAVRDALAVELARIDANVSSRATAADVFAAR
jgi:hypothetical protein